MNKIRVFTARARIGTFYSYRLEHGRKVHKGTVTVTYKDAHGIEHSATFEREFKRAKYANDWMSHKERELDMEYNTRKA